MTAGPATRPGRAPPGGRTARPCGHGGFAGRL